MDDKYTVRFMCLLTVPLILSAFNNIMLNGPPLPTAQRIVGFGLFLTSWFPWFMFMVWTRRRSNG